MSARTGRIRTPVTVHLRRIQHQLIPVLAFFAALWGAFWLWGRHAGLPNAVGEVEAVELQMASPADGVLAPVGWGQALGEGPAKAGEQGLLPIKEWALFDPVSKGALVARLDDRPTRAALKAVTAEVVRLRAEVAAERARAMEGLAEARMDRANHRRRLIVEARTLALDVERVRLDVLDRKAVIETDRIELARQDERLAALKKAMAQGVATSYTLDNNRLRRDIVDQRVKSASKALVEAEAQLKIVCARRDAAVDRLKQTDVGAPPDVDTVVAPLTAAVAAQQARVEEITALAAQLEIRSPIDGMVSEVFFRPGQAVVKGQPIIAVSATKSQHVISYIREYQLIRPEVGMRVRIAIRGIPRRVVEGQIERVGPQVQSVPRHHLSDPKAREWGLPIRIAIAAGEEVKPGELVDISFEPKP